MIIQKYFTRKSIGAPAKDGIKNFLRRISKPAHFDEMPDFLLNKIPAVVPDLSQEEEEE